MYSVPDAIVYRVLAQPEVPNTYYIPLPKTK